MLDSDRHFVRERGDPPSRAAPPTPHFTDILVKRTLLWMFPRSVHPNHMSVARFVLTPVILVLLYYHLRGWAFAVFVVAACTDFIDGAMARTRNQITNIGMVLDPVADKLLIGAVLAWVGYQYLVVQIILGFIFLELVLLAVGLGTAPKGDRARPANAFGKTKMVIQSVALVLFLISGMFNVDPLLTVSQYLLWVAILLAFLSGVMHIRERLSGAQKAAED